jgi:hypothetical protein
MEWSPSKLTQAEDGPSVITKVDLGALLSRHGIASTSSTCDRRFLLIQFEPGFVPGLLQTEDYARPVHCRTRPHRSGGWCSSFRSEEAIAPGPGGLHTAEQQRVPGCNRGLSSTLTLG